MHIAMLHIWLPVESIWSRSSLLHIRVRQPGRGRGQAKVA